MYFINISIIIKPNSYSLQTDGCHLPWSPVRAHIISWPHADFPELQASTDSWSVTATDKAALCPHCRVHKAGLRHLPSAGSSCPSSAFCDHTPAGKANPFVKRSVSHLHPNFIIGPISLPASPRVYLSGDWDAWSGCLCPGDIWESLLGHVLMFSEADCTQLLPHSWNKQG